MPLPTGIDGLSPMMRQYVDIKSKHLNEILFYRLGDFYEMFFDDAVTASKELELVLTGRDCGLKERAPMCGVPYHSCESYIARLIKRGFKVAICEQTEDPALVKGIVKREVVRVVTPGTVTESSMLSEESSNYIACLFVRGKGFGLCFADISAGSLYVTEAPMDELTVISELARYSPSEVLLNGDARKNELLKFIDKKLDAVSTLLYDGHFSMESAKSQILKRFSERDEAPLLELKSGYGVRALGALLKYIEETQLGGSARLVSISVYKCAQYLSISAESRRNLELTESLRGGNRGSLLWVIDKAKNSMGRRKLRGFLEKPLTDSRLISLRLDAVEELFNSPVQLSQIRDSLSKLFDIERLMTRVVYKSCTPRDLSAFAGISPELALIKKICSNFHQKLLTDAAEHIDSLEDISDNIKKTLAENPGAQLRDGGYIRGGFHAEVDELRELLHNGRNVLSRMESELKEKTGIRNLRIGYNRVFGYYIEVSKNSSERVPDNFVRKQTLTSGERYITPELKDLENRILGASERLDALERTLFEDLRAFLESNLRRIQAVADAAALLDVLCGFAALGLENNYVRPVVDDGDEIVISNGRHPVVEHMAKNELFVPNDTRLDRRGNLVNIITGPNMAGKSTYMRQTALIVILAQMGCLVPAKQARIGVVDAIFTRIGASDDLSSGESTFMVEMKEVAHFFQRATKKSLIILDEVGRGTSTYDGMSIARAVIEGICAKNGLRAKTMFATHFHELTVMDREFDCIKNYNIAAKKRDGEVVFLRRIVHGPSDDSYGIEVAKLAGVPDTVIERAKTVLRELENGGGYQRHNAGQTDVPEERKTDGIIERLRGLSLESLTPIEAMYTLNELVNGARSVKE